MKEIRLQHSWLMLANRQGVGIYEQRDKNRWKALEPIWKGIKNFFETTRENVTEGLSLRRDHAI
ncbi:MAG: hypothetical protein HOD13_15370 [Rhodospirillaceae bacterium]|nr:hypothetical protein [Rhodospirillaceae bacterium]